MWLALKLSEVRVGEKELEELDRRCTCKKSLCFCEHCRVLEYSETREISKELLESVI